jgi:glycerol-3-phosphate O-acyltransferase / dihydroxyacetone phosphate acyltransferase
VAQQHSTRGAAGADVIHAVVSLAGDCQIPGTVSQDVNAWSSLAYVAAGLAVAAVWRHVRLATWALAGALAVEGVGSYLFHGHRSDAAQVLHDVALLALLGFIAGWQIGRLGAGSSRGSLGAVCRADRAAVIGWGIGGVAGALSLAVPDAVNVTVVVLAAAVVVAELLARRAGLRGVWGPGGLVLVALALGAYVLGRGDAPSCAPQAVWQWHGLWHVLTALVAVAWVGQAMGRRGDVRPWRAVVDRSLGWFARLMVRAFFRSVDVVGTAPTLDRPTIVAANHGNGFVDPVLVAAALGRLPRFLAKATLWKVIPARPLLAFAGLVPVYRAVDGGTGANADTFRACHDVLAAGGVVAIFPEGTTGDRAQLDTIRTGAARIALGALATAPDVVIVPVGIAYASRTRTRSRAIVMWAPPIPVADWANGRVATAAVDDSDHEAVDALTDTLHAELSAVSPEFASVDEREFLRDAATIAHRHRSGRASFVAAETTARRMATAPPAQRAAVLDALGRYTMRLHNVGVDDEDLAPYGVGSTSARVGVAALIFVFFGPLVTFAVLVHLPVVLLVLGLTGWVRSTATKGTVRLLVGALGGLATWIVTGLILADGWAALGVAAGVAALGAVALAMWTTVASAVARLIGALRVRDRVRLVHQASADREALVQAVEAATANSTEMVSTTPARR